MAGAEDDPRIGRLKSATSNAAPNLHKVFSHNLLKLKYGAHGHVTVSYTHLDVYKRQCI